MVADRVYIDIAAIHEAGHVLTALREGWFVEQASASRVRPGDGRTWMRRPRRTAPFNPHSSPGSVAAACQLTLDRHRAEIRISIAGPLAEAKALGKSLRDLGARSDLITCQRIRRRLERLRHHLYVQGLPGRWSSSAMLNAERESVRRWLARPKVWRQVRAVAERLAEETVLDAEDVHYAIGQVSHSSPRGDELRPPATLLHEEVPPDWRRAPI